MQLRTLNADVFIEFQPLFQPVIQQLHPRLRPAKIFELHLLELARPEGKIAGIDFVTKGFANLRNAKWQLLARNFQHVFELDENRLRSFRPQISDARFVLRGTDEGFEHQIEGAWRS